MTPSLYERYKNHRIVQDDMPSTQTVPVQEEVNLLSSSNLDVEEKNIVSKSPTSFETCLREDNEQKHTPVTSSST